MIKLTTCKRCGETDLIELSKEVPTLDWDSFMNIRGIQCNQCGCFYFEIDNLEVYEFFSREFIDKSKETVGKYMTDYDRNLLEKEYEKK